MRASRWPTGSGRSWATSWRASRSLAFQRSQLLGGVLEGNAAARALAGQLLVFRAAPAERLPPLLKEIGEAFYRWQPKTRPDDSPFEESLAAWLQRTCEAAGLHNTIELVHPGERFDAARHNASSRGVEIAEVLGWVVFARQRKGVHQGHRGRAMSGDLEIGDWEMAVADGQ